jgi:hypothetical protein
MTKRFTAQFGSNNTVRIYDATSGSLHRIINVDGKIVSQPIIMENEISVTVQNGMFNTIKIYNINNGSLKKSIPTQ